MLNNLTNMLFQYNFYLPLCKNTPGFCGPLLSILHKAIGPICISTKNIWAQSVMVSPESSKDTIPKTGESS